MIYKLQLSNKETISITQVEYDKFKNNISANFVELNNRIVNPSFVVSVTPDYEATSQENNQIANEDLKERLNAPMDFELDDIKKLKASLQ